MTELQPGDRIVALASCANGAAVLVGAFSAGITAWLAKHRVSVAAFAALGGAVLGFLIGMVVARVLFPAVQSNVVVVEVGSSPLPLTIKAALGGAVPTAIAVSVLFALLLRIPILHGLWLSLGAGAIIGICWALLASLT